MQINNEKLIFLYRSFIFKFTKFKTNNKELNTIVKALNIKNRKQRILYVYEEAIREINTYYKDDLCQFQNGQCIAQRKKNNGQKNGCCRFCPIATDKGCPSSNIACKLIYCNTALGNLKLLRLKDIKILKCLSPFQRITLRADYFATKEEVISDLYYGIIYGIFRITIKEIKRTLTTKF